MIAWEKWNLRSLASLFKEVTVFNVMPPNIGYRYASRTYVFQISQGIALFLTEVFLTEVFLNPPWSHGRPRLRVMAVRTKMLVFQDFEGLTEVFAPGRPRYPPGRLPDIRPQNLFFGLLFRS